ncbi:MAG: hypothetical protein KAG98_06735 [Lentisphaeria bacterium]|nr:hypothetical protein [Lentisphaeria bacterium]
MKLLITIITLLLVSFSSFGKEGEKVKRKKTSLGTEFNSSSITSSMKNNNIPKNDSVKSYIVLSTPENTIEILDYKFLEEPIHITGSKVVNINNENKDILSKPWWKSYIGSISFDTISYQDYRTYISDSWAKCMTKECVKSISNARKRLGEPKKSISYFLKFSYMGDQYIFIGTTKGHKKMSQMGDGGSYAIFKVINDKWCQDDYDSSKFIFDMNFSYPSKLKEMIENKLVRYYRAKHKWLVPLKPGDTLVEKQEK